MPSHGNEVPLPFRYCIVTCKPLYHSRLSGKLRGGSVLQSIQGLNCLFFTHICMSHLASLLQPFLVLIQVNLWVVIEVNDVDVCRGASSFKAYCKRLAAFSNEFTIWRHEYTSKRKKTSTVRNGYYCCLPVGDGCTRNNWLGKQY